MFIIQKHVCLKSSNISHHKLLVIPGKNKFCLRDSWKARDATEVTVDTYPSRYEVNPAHACTLSHEVTFLCNVSWAGSNVLGGWPWWSSPLLWQPRCVIGSIRRFRKKKNILMLGWSHHEDFTVFFMLNETNEHISVDTTCEVFLLDTCLWRNSV